MSVAVFLSTYFITGANVQLICWGRWRGLGERNEPFPTSYKNLGEFCNLISQQIRDEALTKGFSYVQQLEQLGLKIKALFVFIQRVCVQLNTHADNVALPHSPAAAAERRPCSNQSMAGHDMHC